MSRSVRQERTTRKTTLVKPPRPRRDTFLALVEDDQGFDTVTPVEAFEVLDSYPIDNPWPADAEDYFDYGDPE